MSLFWCEKCGEWIDCAACPPWCGPSCAIVENVSGPNDLFEIHSNNSPDPPDDDDETHEPQDYTGDYGVEGESGGDED